MKDEILAEINEIIKEFEIAKKTKTGVYAEKDFAPDSIPSDLPSFLANKDEKKPRFFISFRIGFNFDEQYIILKEIEINERLGDSYLLFPKLEEFFKKRFYQPVSFGKNLTVRPEDEFDEYSYQFLEILRSLFLEKADHFIRRRDMKIPYFLLEALIPVFEEICLNYVHMDIVPEIELYQEGKNIIINTEKLERWYPLGRRYMIYEDQDKDYKIIKSNYDLSPVFVLKNLADEKKITIPKESFDSRKFIKLFEKILKIKGIEELKSALYKPQKIETGIIFDVEKNKLTASVEAIFDGKRKKEIDEEIFADVLEIKKKTSSAENLLLKKGFVYDNDENKFFMTSESKIFDFVNENLKTEQEDFSHFYLFYSPEFEKRRFISGQITVKIEKKKEFMFYLESDVLSKFQISEILAINKPLKKYYRLENGDIIKLEKTDITKINNILCDISATKFEIMSGEIKRSRYFDFFLNNYNLTSENCKDYFKTVPEIKAITREYQKFGVNWMLNLKAKNMGGILADDMGLGKTIQALGFLRILQYLSPKNVHMVIVPKVVLYNWENEIKKFFKDMKYRIIAGESYERKEKIFNICPGEVVITSYTFLVKDIAFYNGINFSALIIDEAQIIKNRNSLMFKSINKINRKSCFALTGTPIENNLLELWSIFETILPGYLGTVASFKEKYIYMRNNDVLRAFIKPFILRRMKDKVENMLPDKTEQNIILELAPEQRKMYERAVIECTEKVLLNEEIQTFQILRLMTRLRKICTYPGWKIENYNEISGKEKALDELLEKLIPRSHKIIVFSQFTTGLKKLTEKYSEKYKTLYLDGNTSARKRVKLVEKFNTEDYEVFFVSLKAGGVGLNITGADTVIHYDPWWNPAVESQATDRAHRIGQKKDVTVYNFITKATIEEYIYKLKEEKRALSRDILDNTALEFSKEDLMKFFKLNRI